MTPLRHGLYYTYAKRGCRCDDCRKAVAVYRRARRAANRERLAVDPSLAEHGSPWTYCNWGCRCSACRAAWAAECRRKRSAS